jgi:anaerobic selenocysteine-containing dehydrogenase
MSESGAKVVKSTCELCYQGCGVLIHMEGGRPVKVRGDPNDPVSRGAICIKGTSSLEYLDNPLRLRHPLKRIGSRGEGKWREISWDQALDEVASKLAEMKSAFGAESVAFMRGAAKGYQDTYSSRFANAFGSPNVSSTSHVCFVCRANAQMLTYGALMLPDYEYPPALILMWAVNTHNTAAGEWKRTMGALEKGPRLVVIDPWESDLAKIAHLWARPRPATDLALALGMINVIVAEGLYDKEFVEKLTTGFDELVEHVRTYTPENVAEVTWVPAETIRDMARAYATIKPACLVLGNGIDNNINNFQTARAVSILRAITGNLGKPGTDIEWSDAGVVPRGSPELNAQNAVSPEVRAKWLSAQDGMMPIVHYALPQTIFSAILTGRPYPIRAVFVQGTNLLNSMPESQVTRNALEKVDFLVVSDLFMTPTAELADIVLPVTCFLEMNNVHEGEYAQAANVVQKVVETPECRSDYQIFAGLAKRMGLESYFKSEEGMLDFLIGPSGFSFDEFRKIGAVSGARMYRKHERAGFNTPSKKVELYSARLAEWGFDPLPVYREPPESPVSSPELASRYPFVLTNHKVQAFQHSQGRMIRTLRGTRPEPLVHIQSGVASKLGIGEGDWVYIETSRGRVKQRANLVPSIDPRVIIADYGWWFPEQDSSSLHGWKESNLNILTYSGKPWGRELGTPTLRGIVCNVYKATDG